MKKVNIYSKSKDPLGRWLSNFTYHPIETEDGYFESIEGYWYWLSCKEDRLRYLHGFNAKKIGRELGGADWPKAKSQQEIDEFQRKIKEAIRLKIETAPKKVKELMREKDIEFEHYYEYGGKRVDVPEGQWIIDYIQSVLT